MRIIRNATLAFVVAQLSGVWLMAAPWKPHVVRQCNGAAAQIRIPAKLQIVTESWNRVVAVPYLVYMPEKDRLLMLVGCDYPHRAMLTESDDHGVTWSPVRPVVREKPLGMGTGLTYLGQGRLMMNTGDQRWFSRDYGATWGDPVAVGPAPDGRGWAAWDPWFAERDATTGQIVRLVETGYTSFGTPGSGQPYERGYLRFSSDLGRMWTAAVQVPQWNGVSEVAIVQAASGDWVAGCRTDISPRWKGKELDHFEGLGVSISNDRGMTWSAVQRLYDWGRHHPSLLLMPSRDILMTYVVRNGYVDTADGFPQFGIEAVVSHDNGQTWDLDHRYLLDVWPGNRKGRSENQPGPQAWWASSQATSTVLLLDGSLLTAFGTGYRSQPGPGNLPTPRDVGLVLWRVADQPLNADRTIRDARPDSDLRNLFDPATGRPAVARTK
jgi:hypothetical protein